MHLSRAARDPECLKSKASQPEALSTPYEFGQLSLSSGMGDLQTPLKSESALCTGEDSGSQTAEEERKLKSK